MRAACLALLLVAPVAAWAGPEFDVAGRATAFALIASDNNEAGVDAYKAILAKDPRFAFDRINLAIGQLKKSENKEALEQLDAAVKIEAGYPGLPYLRGLALKRLRQYKEAIAAFQDALKASPGCREAYFQVGLIHEYENRNADASAAFNKLLEFTPDQARRQSIAHGQAMYLAHKHLSFLAANEGHDDEAEKHTDEAQKFGGNNPPQEQALDLGPCAAMVELTDAAARKELARESVTLPVCQVPALVLEPQDFPAPKKISPLSVMPVGWTTSGLVSYWAGSGTMVKEGGAWKAGADPGPGRVLAAGDVDGDGREDVVVASEAGAVEVRPFPPGKWPAVPLAGAGGVTAAIAVDEDHDGDLDVIVAGRIGDRVGLFAYLNQTKPGAAAPVLALASHEQCGLTTAVSVEVTGLAAGDVDEGNDIDLVAFLKDAPPLLFLSKRQGKFDRVEVKGPPGTGPGVLADLDGDGLLDLAYPTGKGVELLIGRGDGTFQDPREIAVPGGLRSLQAADLDGDMRLDLVGVGDDQKLKILLGTADGFAAPLASVNETTSLKPMIADLDGDGAPDIVCSGGRVLMNRSAAKACFVRVTLNAAGGMSNTHNVGGRIWVRSGARLIRREVTHAGEVFALGGCQQADLVRVQWTNGVLQHYLADKPGGGKTTVVACGTDLALSQPAGLSGSCPYLYVDAGQGQRYLTDVLAGAPLGLPGSDGKLVPSSPRELVAVPRGAWAVVRDRYRFRVTEEYREVTYLDQARLWVVDHPHGRIPLAEAGIGAPADAARLRWADRVEPVVAARDEQGRDVTALLRDADGKHLEPPRGALQGLAPEHALELTLPRFAKGDATWLLLTGFVYWTDAGLNTRLAQADPGLLSPPRLDVPDGRGGWKTALPFVRFPAGRTKTALVDVTGLVDPADPRVRLVTSMRIYLDRVALATARTAGGVGGVARMEAPREAEVVHHGIAPLLPGADDPPWVVDAEHRRGSLEASWLVPAGFYTRYGDVAKLLEAFDDRYVILGPGDGVEMGFEVPRGPAPGLERDLFLEVCGWDKDAHPCTFASGSVEPLPYRGMPEYGSGAVFPAGKQAELRGAMREWNTRWRKGWGGTAP